MKVVFLDIDGVLNSSEYLYSPRHVSGSRKIDPLAVERLNRITDATGAVVVVSSTWRIMGLDPIRALLAEHGVKAPIIDVTPEDNGTRGQQIGNWLSSHDVESFVIFDDDNDMGDLARALVQTDFEFGLADKHVSEAMAILLAA
jgi:hypothetical protein